MDRFCLLVLMPFFLTLLPVDAEANGQVLIRQKRDWITAPRKLIENKDYTGLASIARIRSDKENFTKIFYSLKGPGVDQPPIGIFGVNRDTGYVKIFAILDREAMPFYHLLGVAHFANGSLAEKDIDLKITVEDENDCPPVIEIQQIGYVKEASAAGTAIMRVRATDADQPNHPNSQIRYSIVEQGSSAGMFFIDPDTGDIMVQRNTLDRETQDTYKVMIKASDLNGQPGGHTGTGEVEIKLLDINDNIPTLEKESYEGSVEENTINLEVMRIQSRDMDLKYTDNWWAEYSFASGNEAGYFSIVTDNKTNEGIIIIRKPLDYEALKVLNLEVAVSNRAAYNFGSTTTGGGNITTKSYPITINVVNQKEGPHFHPAVKVVSLSEDRTSVAINKIIANYAATDSDTLKTATNVRYVKIRDADNWLIIDEKTGDIRLNKLPDRESKFLKNGTYFAEIICTTNDSPSKTATGTIAIQVEDFNDHCPELTTTTHTMCLKDNVIYVTAVDQDDFPNSAPFEFTVNQERSKGKWTVEQYNDTTAILRDHAKLWPGIYSVAVEVSDQQGKSCADVQMVDITVCTCTDDTKTCVGRRTKTTSLGAGGILLPLLGLLLLLLVPLLLLFCLCGGASTGDFKTIPFDTKQQLIAYHTEGQGEDKEVPLMTAPVEVDHGAKGAANFNTFGRHCYYGGITAGELAAGGAALGGGFSTLTTENIHQHGQYQHSSGHMDMATGLISGGEHHLSTYRADVYEGMALSEEFLGEYYTSKANHAALQSQEKDAMLVYDYEGRGSPAGSVGCCSLLENNDDLAFLNDIGPQFKTLAEICQGKSLVTESVAVDLSVLAPTPVSPVRPSTHTHIHTHTETLSDQASANIKTTNVASGSSTIIQTEHLTERAQSTAAPNVHIQDNVVIPNPTLLVQQPAMYYAATPMYVVDAKPQVVYVAGGTQQPLGQVGVSQGLVQVGGLQGSQEVVLVDRQVGMGGVAAQAAPSVLKGTMSKTKKVLLVENGSAGGGHSAQLGQGFVQVGQGSTVIGGLQGSQGVLLVDRQVGAGGGAVQAASLGRLSRSSVGSHGTHSPQGFVQIGQGSTEQGLDVRSQDVLMASQSSLLGSDEDFAIASKPMVPSGQRVMVQRKKVSVTERTTDSSIRA
ncbi:desmoglein-2-like [Thalassophryne amazonica]|uniref:desmoglein-2-like n=1 Tax=Thalassophryne amazonica TaxID=390379 RepID=UPI001470F933|nr:desmoglein-2-like [Thalassophryne amazonica]